MAKRKAAAARGRKAAGSSRSRSSARKPARGGARKAKKTAKRKAAAPKASARKSAGRKATARKAVAKRAAPRKSSAKAARKGTRPAAKAAAPRRSSRQAAQPRKTPALNRPRRTVGDENVPTPPSSLDMDRSASAARSGRKEMKEKRDELTQTGPALTGGDVDADWESAYSVGDEAPGGDNPTPDQDVVDDIGRAIGVEYEDNEELKGEAKITSRDKHRWELDPASSEDYNDR